MRKPNIKSTKFKLQKRHSEEDEVELLEAWIESGKPESGSNPLSLPPLPEKSRVGRLSGDAYSPYAGCKLFKQLPLSKNTKKGLAGAGFKEMTDIQRASLPHALCGRDILGAAKTGSGKTLAFVIPILEKLYRARWGPEVGVGCIIMSPTRELAGQLFDVLKTAGKFHGFSAGLLIGGRKDVDEEKERVNELNILVCTPGRLLQHMDETPNFNCSELQVLVLDEADRILDVGFKKALNAIISQLPKNRQTLLFSATQTKSVQDLARLSLKDPEYIGVHEEAETATPSLLQQTFMIVPLEQKLDLLWSFVKAHLNSRILVFLSTCKQVKFAFETFKKLRPGIPLKCLHGRMKQGVRMGIYSEFCEQRSVLFCTDVASRGLDFDKAVDWVIQVDCPEDVAAYIHRVGRTARYHSGGKSVLFLMPSEMEMLNKLKEKKIPIRLNKANSKRLQPVSGLLAALLVKYPNFQQLAQRAFITYLKSVYVQRDKEVFDVKQLSIDDYSASLGLPMTPKLRFINQKVKGNVGSVDANKEDKSESKGDTDKAFLFQKEGMGTKTDDAGAPPVMASKKTKLKISVHRPLGTKVVFDDEGNNTSEHVGSGDANKEDKSESMGDTDKAFLFQKEGMGTETDDAGAPPVMISKKKKLKISVHRPLGTKVVFDDEGNTLAPLERLANGKSNDDLVKPDKDKVLQRYEELRKELKSVDPEDKALDRQRRKERRLKAKLKKRSREEDDEMESDEDESGSDEESGDGMNRNKKAKKMRYDDSGSDGGESVAKDKLTVAEQEQLALKLLESMHS